MTKILFYSTDTEYGWMSNFHLFTMTIDNIQYNSNEHFYQSKKAGHEQLESWIRKAPTPYLAMKVGRSLKDSEMVEDWENKKVEVMLKGLRAKFTQNLKLKKKLLDTGNSILHENSPSDMFWGVKGQDMLGKLLMQVREELRIPKLDRYKHELTGEIDNCGQIYCPICDACVTPRSPEWFKED